jgi:FAD synthetase
MTSTRNHLKRQTRITKRKTRVKKRPRNLNHTQTKVKNKPKVVLASGVFDLLHLGHVRFLEEAKKTGGPNAKLVVIVARDSTVEKKKGKKPVVSENQRRALVESLRVVDEAILGYENFDMGKVIQKIRPDIIAVGHDSHTSGLEQAVKNSVTEKGLKIKIVKIGKFSEDELDSSSKIKQKIIEQFKR